MKDRPFFSAAMIAFDSLPAQMRAFFASYHSGFSDEAMIQISALYRSGHRSSEQILSIITRQFGPPQKVEANAKAKYKSTHQNPLRTR